MRARSARPLASTLLALAVLGAGVTPASARRAPSETPETTVRPASLDRGRNPAIPQLLGRTILDGDRRIRVAGEEVQLLGTSGDDYVVLVYPHTGRARVQRIAADGTSETVMSTDDGDLALSRDGQQLFESVARADAHTVVTVRDPETGARELRRTFRGHVSVLDADRGRAILGASSPPRTFRWNTRTGGTVRISGRAGYFADLRADRYATVTGTGEDLCSVLSSLPPETEVLWRSCARAVVAASPNGQRLVTQTIYSDGPVNHLQVRGDHGRLIAGYAIAGHFGRSTFETSRAVLVQAYGTTKAAIARCLPGDCERASRRMDVP